MLLSVEDLCVAYGAAAPAIDGVSIAIEAGRSLALIGESGSGKSTTALAVLGLLPAGARVVRGAVRFEGRDLVRLDGKARAALCGSKLAMVFQDAGAALHPMRTVGDQVGEPLRIHRGLGAREARREAVELLRRVRMDDAEACAARYPHQLSGGMRQRALLAQSLACRPSLLMLDEPTSALDLAVQAQVLDLVDELRAEYGMAVLHVTHDLALAAQRCDAVAVLHAGRIVEEGPAAEVLRRPRHPSTAALVAATERSPGAPGATGAA